MTVNIKIVALISFIALLSGNSHAENYEKSVINHRLILKGAESSGIEFIGSDKVVMYAEITGDMPIVEARVKWIGNNFFYMVENGQNCTECPPRSWLYKIESIKNNEVSMLEFNNTWPAFKDEVSVYTLRMNKNK
ncbi:hypothetical protein [Plesiomonas shigelloides]|uniref:hypothetical protein n=1 Tax=Plesiomonas shigelloides TaxID=703 RepID=UPI001E494024|nr:hypothetical protein [Plesiomonas shigelloides]